MKILVIASGGDAPGINHFLWYLQKKFSKEDIFFSEYGLNGIYKNKYKKLKKSDQNILYDLPSSFIKCGRFPDFETNINKRNKVIKNLSFFNYLIILGGDGTQKAAKIIASKNIKTIFVPLTVDNDVKSTDETLGFHTSLNNSINNINNISYTIQAHGYVGLVEIMGRGCSDLTQESLKYSRANIATHVNELFSPIKFAEYVKKIHKNQGYCIGLIMEKMKYSIEDYKNEIDKLNLQCRNTSLGHTQRGGKTSLGDIKLAYKFVGAIESIFNKKASGTIAIKKGVVKLNEFK